jgi:hypothetical protein
VLLAHRSGMIGFSLAVSRFQKHQGFRAALLLGWLCFAPEFCIAGHEFLDLGSLDWGIH